MVWSIVGVVVAALVVAGIVIGLGGGASKNIADRRMLEGFQGNLPPDEWHDPTLGPR